MAEQGSMKNWILLSYFFNVDAKACSQHLDSRIPYMASSGIEPVVLSGLCGERSKSGEHYRVSSIAPSGMRFELRYLKRRNRFFKLAAAPLLVAILPLYLLEKMLINLESEWSWFLPAFLRGLFLHKRFRFNLIYSTGGPPCAHLAAGLLARCIKRPWIAELQDPIVVTNWSRSGAALKIHAWLEGFILKNASAVIFLTEGARERALARNKVEGRKVHVIYPGACASQSPEATYRKKEFCRFSHFGSLGGSRNPEKFLEAIGLLLDAHPELIEKVRLEFYGAMDAPSRKLISRFKYRDIVADPGKVSWSEALKAMRETDVLVLLQNMDDLSYETIPSKFYEYLQAKRPILG
ncbi:MAG: glycosyltransferase, partial [Syntrophobacteraceae bacterium]